MFEKESNSVDNNLNIQRNAFFRSPIGNLGLLFVIILLGMIIGNGLILTMNMIAETPLIDSTGNITMVGLAGRHSFRLMAAINQVTMFYLPALLCAWLVQRKYWQSYLGLFKHFEIEMVLMGIVLMLCSFPLVQYLMEINKMLPLPAWMHSMETTTNNAIKDMLKVDFFYEFVLNIIVIAVVPAIGEEMIFRGILQTQLIKHFKSMPLGIWISAAIFSAIHGQFEGFFSRLLMGALLGYIFYYSRSLWVSIAAHFCVNGLQITAQYVIQQKNIDIDMDKTDNLDWYWVLCSLLLTVAILKWFSDRFQNRQEKQTIVQTNS